MNLKNKPPMFVPTRFQDEIEKLSKAALMDIAWDYATRCAAAQTDDSVMTELRAQIDIIQIHRNRK